MNFYSIYLLKFKFCVKSICNTLYCSANVSFSESRITKTDKIDKPPHP